MDRVARHHHGEFYHFDDITIEPKPRKGPLDIWIGGKSDAILRRVVRLGDGWFPALTSPEEFRHDMHKLMAFGEQLDAQLIHERRECYC